MVLRTESLNRLLINYFKAASLHRRPYARKYVKHNEHWTLMTAGRSLPIILDYCHVGQLTALTRPLSQNSLHVLANILASSHFQWILLFRKMSLC
jgi:hypothetical protein